MENSSKALLIAAAVLIVILLITFGIKVFSSAKSAGDIERTSEELALASQSGTDAVSKQIGIATGSSPTIEREQGEAGSGSMLDGTGNGSESVTTAWTHKDTNNNREFDVGEIVTKGTEGFYVIASNSRTVTLLAEKCVNTNTNKQSDKYNAVAFNSEKYINKYDDSTIKLLVDAYFRKLGLQNGRLMSKAEAEALETEHADILYGTTTKWNFWLSTPDPGNGDDGWVWIVISNNNYEGLDSDETVACWYYGVRPVIVISKSDIK